MLHGIYLKIPWLSETRHFLHMEGSPDRRLHHLTSVPFTTLVLRDKGYIPFEISPLRNTLLLCGFLETSSPNEPYILSHTQSEKLSKQSELTQCCLSTATSACQSFFLKRFLPALTVNLLHCFHFKYAFWGLKHSLLCPRTGSSLAFTSVVISSLISACSLSRVAGTWHPSSLAYAWCLFQARSVFCQIHCAPLAVVKCQGQISHHIFYLSCNSLLRKHYYTD